MKFFRTLLTLLFAGVVSVSAMAQDHGTKDDAKGVTLAHGANDKLVGKNMMELKDQNGKMFVHEITNLAATKGEGWVDYDWAHPVTKKVDGKSTYVKRIPGFDGSVSVGTYR